MSPSERSRRLRWRLVLGVGLEESAELRLDPDHQALDDCLSALYEAPVAEVTPHGGLARSAPRVSQWLSDIRRLFDADVVRMLQGDAFRRLELARLLLEPELLSDVEPDLALATTLLALREEVPERSREAVRAVVAEVVRRLRRELEAPLIEVLRKGAGRRRPVRRPKAGELDPHATIRANLRHYQPELQAILPVELRGWRRSAPSRRELVLLVDQSASMARSLIHACVMASVLARLPALRTRLVTFDSAVVDLSAALSDDPVDLLFGVELGGGTDIAQALRYVQYQLHDPREALVFLISDLFEGGDRREVLARVARLLEQSVHLVVLLALDDEGIPSYDEVLARKIVGLGVPVLSCTPNRFPELLGRALYRDLDLR